MDKQYPITERSKAKRLRERATYDVGAVYALLDASLLCHIAYVIDGQPFCTPTTFWRRGNLVVWHGSVGSRMLREQGAKHLPVCLTVSHLDSIVATRSAFGHTVNNRSAMLFGRAELIEAPEERLMESRLVMDHFLPGRSGLVVPPTPQELKTVSFLKMNIEEAVVKVRNYPASHEPPQHRGHKVWAGQIPIETRIREPVPCELLDPGIPKGPDIARYHEGARLDETLSPIRHEAQKP
jgi:nitroimidazol reductase NimA-like FMN-containing flavoprotein (pyridoxamine 5'-phosphate oxidase superfamily)